MADKRIFKTSEVESGRSGYTADLSPSDTVNPDCYWWFRTKKQAVKFLELVDSGSEPRSAERIADRE